MPEITRERDPDADLPYFDEDVDSIVVHFYNNPHPSLTPTQRQRIYDDMKEQERKPSPWSNPIGSGFTPAEVAQARAEQERMLGELDDM